LTASLGAAGTLTLLIAGVSALAKGGYRNSSTLLGDGGTAGRPRRLHGRRTSAANRTGTAGHTTADHAQTAGHARSKAPSLPAGAVPIAAASQLARGRAAIYRDPSDGQPDIIIRQPDGSLSAFSAICTHAGCEVGYEGGQIACPCHGGVYNPRTGAVESGPPPTPLPARRVLQHAGKIYALRD
jgi:thiosulfate dehydrogenase [quinone] large subunit